MSKSEIKETILLALYKYRDEYDHNIKKISNELGLLSNEEINKIVVESESKKTQILKCKTAADKTDAVIEWVKKIFNP